MRRRLWGVPVTALTVLAALALAPATQAAPAAAATQITPATQVATSHRPAQAAWVRPPRLSTTVRLAQTHVVKPGGLSFTTPSGGAQQLQVVGRRRALVTVRFGQSGVRAPQLLVWRDTLLRKRLALNPPSRLPATEEAGPAPGSRLWSVVLPARYVVPGLRLSTRATGFRDSPPRAVAVGADTTLRMDVLPFYLFGATPENGGVDYAQVRDASPDVKAQIVAEWPVARLAMRNHPAGLVQWPSIVVSPRTDNAGVAQPAYVLTGMEQQREGWAAMSAVLGLLGAIRSANGDSPTNTQYYAPIRAWNNTSNQATGVGGGLGGGGVGTGDVGYAGIFIHEQGHAFGLGHAASDFAAGTYPYENGSLAGSAWGYDQRLGRFLSTQVPPSRQGNCTSGHVLIGSGPECYKQDPMQSGAGDQTDGYAFTMFSDYNAARIQRWLQGGPTTDNGDGTVSYDGGRIFVKPASPTGYARWNSLTSTWDPVTPETTDNGIYGTLGGLPVRRGVPVATVLIARSNAGTPGATTVYPPLTYQGNLLRTFDPTVAADRAAIVPNTGELAWYCSASGCDYSARVTLADGTVSYVVLQGGFRPWFGPTDPEPTATQDPLSSSSQRTWAVNLPTGGQAVTSVELLSTPMVWSLSSSQVQTAPVLASWHA